jgi:hypothetical protein
MKMYNSKSITPDQLLPVGTSVGVNNMRGTVINSRFEKDQFGMPICVHTIKYDSILVDRYRKKYKKIDITQRCNYASIHEEIVEK